MSLRERSKARRRRHIQLTALRLFAERGYDGATLAEIAVAADVAPRTVSLYFPAKIELALGHPNDVADRLSRTVRSHADADFLDILNAWLEVEERERDVELARATDAMFAANPALRSVATAPVTAAMDEAGAALHAQLGLARSDPLARVITAALAAAVIEYLAVASVETPSPQVRTVLLERLIPGILAASGARKPRSSAARGRPGPGGR